MSVVRRAWPHFGVPLVLFLALAPGGAAQVVQGRVAEGSARLPVQGVMVTLVDQDGRTAAQVLTDASGRYRLRAPAGGRYHVRAKRIGVRPFTSPVFALAVNDVRELPIAVEALPTQAAAVQVTGRQLCADEFRRDEVAAALWEDIRTALQATRLTAQRPPFEAEVMHVTRQLDHNARRVRKEDRATEKWTTIRPFYSASAAELSRLGYVRSREDGTHAFFAPDAEVLLSDVFVADHCFRVVDGGKDQPGQVGLSFTPNLAREVPDVQGTLWVDARTKFLRSMDFEYSRLPHEGAVGKAGGSLRFVPIPGGGWVVRRWTIRVPQIRKLEPTVGAVRSGGSRLAARDTITGYVEEGGEITDVAFLQPVRSSVTGVLRDSTTGALLPGAIVRLAGTASRATSDSTGRYELTDLLEGSYELEVIHPADTSGAAVLRDLVLDAGEVRVVDLSVPSVAPPTVTMNVTAIDSMSGRPIPGVEVAVGAAVRGTTDSAGRLAVTFPAGSAPMVVARRLGYRPRVLRPASDATSPSMEWKVSLVPATQQLAGVTVTAQGGRLAAFEARRASASGFFMSEGEIQKRNALSLADLLRAAPGIAVAQRDDGAIVAISRRGGNRMVAAEERAASGGRTVAEVVNEACVVRLVVDGQLMPEAFSLGDISPAMIGALEVYASGAALPREFTAIATQLRCGMIAVWTVGG